MPNQDNYLGYWKGEIFDMILHSDHKLEIKVKDQKKKAKGRWILGEVLEDNSIYNVLHLNYYFPSILWVLKEFFISKIHEKDNFKLSLIIWTESTDIISVLDNQYKSYTFKRDSLKSCEMIDREQTKEQNHADFEYAIIIAFLLSAFFGPVLFIIFSIFFPNSSLLLFLLMVFVISFILIKIKVIPG